MTPWSRQLCPRSWIKNVVFVYLPLKPFSLTRKILWPCRVRGPTTFLTDLHSWQLATSSFQTFPESHDDASFHASTWLGRRVTRYLVGYYSGCSCSPKQRILELHCLEVCSQNAASATVCPNFPWPLSQMTTNLMASKSTGLLSYSLKSVSLGWREGVCRLTLLL